MRENIDSNKTVQTGVQPIPSASLSYPFKPIDKVIR